MLWNFVPYITSSLWPRSGRSSNSWRTPSSSWGSWEEAINAHVAGLASGYGYSLTYAAAQKYCPPNYDHWFHNTLAQMMMI